MITVNLENREETVNELAGMAARRIAISKQGRDQGLSWSKARKESINAQADQTLKNFVREALNQGKEPRNAVRFAVENSRKEAS